MRGVYTSAERVVVWLGEEHDTQPQEALSLFKELDSGSKHIGIVENALKSWHDIFSRPWWTRTRILQEVLHDRPVMAYIGQTQIEFDYLCSKHYCYRIPEVINHRMTEREPWLLLHHIRVPNTIPCSPPLQIGVLL